MSAGEMVKPVGNPHMALLKLARECPHAGPASCGCNSVRRCSRLGRDVSLRECLKCVNGDA